MNRKTSLLCAILVSISLAVSYTVSVHGQIGKSPGIIDPNVAAEKDLLALPHMTPAIVKGIMKKRPFMSITELNAFLLGQSLTQPQVAEFYAKAFIHVNLNTGTREEILLIPGAGSRMAREFAEFRPWKSFAQFDREIGKYVGAKEVPRLERYVTIQ